MIFLAAVSFLAGFVVEPPQLSDQAAAAKYQAECQGSKADSKPCKELQWQLEYALYLDIKYLSSHGTNVGDDTLRFAAGADCPQLKALALDLLFSHRISPGDEKLVEAALEDPYPGVRKRALQIASGLPQYRERAERAGRGRQGSDKETGLAVADVPPAAAALPAPVYAGAHYSFLASDPTLALFETSDPADKVIAFYSKRGKKVLDAVDLRKSKQAAKQDPMAMAKAMQEAIQRGEDPKKVIAQAQSDAMAGGQDFTEGIEGKPGVRDARYVVLKSGTTGPTQVVAVFKDEALGGTSIVFRLPKPLPPSDPKKADHYLKLQQLLQEGK